MDDLAPLTIGKVSYFLKVGADSELQLLSADSLSLEFESKLPVKMQNGDMIDFFYNPANPTQTAAGVIFSQEGNTLTTLELTMNKTALDKQSSGSLSVVGQTTLNEKPKLIKSIKYRGQSKVLALTEG